MSKVIPFLKIRSPIIVGACLASLSAPALADDDATVYGRLNTAIEYSSVSGAGNGGALRETNNRSVFGFRGQEALGNDMRVTWQIESNLSLQTGQGQIAGRNSRIGLQTAYGLLFFGHWHTPYTEATMAYDPYYPTTAGYMALIGNGSASSSDNIDDTSAFDRRQQNTVQYRSPTWRGLSLSLGWGVPQESKTVAPDEPALYSAAVTYAFGPMNATVAYEQHRHYHAASRNDDAYKAGVSYQILPGTLVSILYEHLHYRTDTGDLQRDGYYASLVQQFGPGSVRVGVALASNGRGSADETIGFVRSGPQTGATQLTVGYDYPLSKRTALYAYYSRIDNRKHAAYDFAINDLGVETGEDAQTFAIGMRHNF